MQILWSTSNYCLQTTHRIYTHIHTHTNTHTHTFLAGTTHSSFSWKVLSRWMSYVDENIIEKIFHSEGCPHASSQNLGFAWNFSAKKARDGDLSDCFCTTHSTLCSGRCFFWQYCRGSRSNKKQKADRQTKTEKKKGDWNKFSTVWREEKPMYLYVCLLWIDEAKANIKPIYECRCNERL